MSATLRISTSMDASREKVRGGRPSDPVSVGQIKALVMANANRGISEEEIQRVKKTQKERAGIESGVASEGRRAIHLPGTRPRRQNLGPERWETARPAGRDDCFSIQQTVLRTACAPRRA